jgi:cyclase
MLRTRVIPCLLLREDRLVKTRKFADPKYVGDPINAIRIFNDKEVDELLVLDITASQQRREPNYELIEQFASECFMPLTYGGGVHSVDQARRLFSLGVEKICIQSAALADLGVVTRITELFGSQSVAVCADVKKDWRGRHRLYSSRMGKIVKRDWAEFLRAAVAAGAGEVVVNSVDRDGTMTGPDLDLVRDAGAAVSVPVIAMGGVGSLKDIRAAVDAGASAVAAGAFFVFHGPHRAVLITYPSYHELEQILGKTL